MKLNVFFFSNSVGEMWQDTGDDLWKHRDEATVISTILFIHVEVSPTPQPLSESDSLNESLYKYKILSSKAPYKLSLIAFLVSLIDCRDFYHVSRQESYPNQFPKSTSVLFRPPASLHTTSGDVMATTDSRVSTIAQRSLVGDWLE